MEWWLSLLNLLPVKDLIKWLGKKWPWHREPRLYVHPVKSTTLWCNGHADTMEIFQFVFDAALSGTYDGNPLKRKDGGNKLLGGTILNSSSQ